MTPIEELLFNAFIDYGILPICEYQIGRYRVDFCFLAEKLIVEADGKEYHKDKNKDRIRDRNLGRLGYKVIRFTGSQIYKDAHRCAKMVRKELKLRMRK